MKNRPSYVCAWVVEPQKDKLGVSLGGMCGGKLYEHSNSDVSSAYKSSVAETGALFGMLP